MDQATLLQLITPLLTPTRYQGTDVAVMTPWTQGVNSETAFGAAYEREFGFRLERPIVVDDIRVRATGRANPLPETKV